MDLQKHTNSLFSIAVDLRHHRLSQLGMKDCLAISEGRVYTTIYSNLITSAAGIAYGSLCFTSPSEYSSIQARADISGASSRRPA